MKTEGYRVKEYLGMFRIQAKIDIVKYKYDWFPFFGRNTEEWQTLQILGPFKSLDNAFDMIKTIRKGIIYHYENNPSNTSKP